MTTATTESNRGFSYITKRIPNPAEEARKAKTKGHAGVYRVIHGNITVVRPWEEWHGKSGKPIKGASRTITARCVPTKFAMVDDKHEGIRKGDPIEWKGDEIWLNDEDAYRLLALDYPAAERLKHARVEKLTDNPSRCGTVWQPPKPTSLNDPTP